MTVIEEHFNSIGEMLEELNKRKKSEVMEMANESQSDNFDFSLTKDWEEAIELYQYGYLDILEEVKSKLKKEMKVQKAVKNRKVTTAVQGFVPHVPNALLGLPNSMINIKQEPKKVKAISIIYAITANAGTEAEDFIKSGISLLALINNLELQGIRVNLKIMFNNAYIEDEAVFGTVNVKGYREHLDIQKLCFPIAHPSMFRRIGFKWLETIDGLSEDDWAELYGYTIEDEEEMHERFKFKKDEYFINLQITEKCDYDVAKIAEYIGI